MRTVPTISCARGTARNPHAGCVLFTQAAQSNFGAVAQIGVGAHIHLGCRRASMTIDVDVFHDLREIFQIMKVGGSRLVGWLPTWSADS